jgi:hypothetical protein
VVGQGLYTKQPSRPALGKLLIGWRDRGCAVGVHDRQDSGIGRRIAVGSRNGRPVGRSQYIV